MPSSQSARKRAAASRSGDDPILLRNPRSREVALRKVGAALVELIDPDPKRQGLEDTPARFARAVQEWFSGYTQDPTSVIRVFKDGAEEQDEIVVQKGIQFWSHCEHHIAPFFGVVHIGYLPCGQIVGLSKFARLVRVFSHRLQVQERLTSQIAGTLKQYVSPNVAVIVKARHFCMESRGAHAPGTETTTSAMHGVFRNNPAARAEFLSLVNAP